MPFTDCKSTLGALLLLIALCITPTAFAHTHLLQTTPAADSTASRVNELRLGFSEGVEAKFSQVTITSTGGASVAVDSIASDPNDAKILIVTPRQPLAPGHYQVHWKAVSVDTHKSAGDYRFTVGQ